MAVRAGVNHRNLYRVEWDGSAPMARNLTRAEASALALANLHEAHYPIVVREWDHAVFYPRDGGRLERAPMYHTRGVVAT